ncbi:class I SAM-dependent methyltransferase [Micromonospora soli]|uniref:class I SAM-dependent methyltransferase n=1 Tax=Micromonospora sp. NBRC 110009 TaxID=3061627 RepID=UPI0026710093|nr:class I SAM-dependent methyltransferase [Micromonospora sp. NBRC 110009]WKT97538.1 class I SAM-dependent methyltransferase [Micromonospora sp. NBRC 110009]
MAVAPEVDGVPETALWTLHHRVLEAKRPDAMFADPRAVDLVTRMDFPFAERFGEGFRTQTQLLALRVRCFDIAVSEFLVDHPAGTVVALGEGLETQFWRVDNGLVRWLTVDLPPSARLRERLLPRGDRQRLYLGSALDLGWMDEVDDSEAVLITAQGLLMYFRPEDVHRLLSACAERFPGGVLVLDTVAYWMARAVRRASTRAAGYRPPEMHWCLDSADWQSLRQLHPNIAEVTEVRSRAGRGPLAWLPPNVHRIPLIRGRRSGVVRLRFGPEPVAP